VVRDLEGKLSERYERMEKLEAQLRDRDVLGDLGADKRIAFLVPASVAPTRHGLSAGWGTHKEPSPVLRCRLRPSLRLPLRRSPSRDSLASPTSCASSGSGSTEDSLRRIEERQARMEGVLDAHSQQHVEASFKK
jgi:hypothetical protein